MKNLKFFILILFTVNSYCCDCKIISKVDQFNNSDFVFLGKITTVRADYFEVKVIEVFKGKIKSTIKSFINNCLIYPTEGEVWLLYVKSNDGNEFDISQCGNSRSFNKPHIYTISNIPPPPPNSNNYLIYLFSDSYYKMALIELNADISELRLIKTQNEMEKIKTKYKDLNSQFTFFKWILLLLIIIIWLWSK